MISYFRFIILFLLFVLPVNFAFSQSTYNDELNNKEYDKVEHKLLRDYSKIPDDLMVNFDMSILFNMSDYKNFNPDTAYYFGKRTEKIYNGLPQKQREKLIRNSIYLSVIRDQILKVCASLYDKYAEKNTVESFNYFLDTYRDSPDLLQKATEARNALAFSLVQMNPTIDKYQQFIAIYPKSIQLKDAIVLRDSMEYALAAKSNKALEYQKFITKHQSSILLQEARLAYDKTLFLESVNCKNVVQIIDFASKNQKSSYLPAIFDSLFHVSINNDSYEGLKFYVENCAEGKYINDAWKKFYSIFTQDGYIETYDFFQSNYQNRFPFMSQFQSDYDAAVLGRSLDLDNGYDAKKDSLYWKYMRLASQKDYAFRALQVLIAPAVKAKKWTDAQLIIENAMTIFGAQNKFVSQLYDILKAPLDGIKVESLGNNVNSSAGSEYVPIISADNKKLYFCGSKRKDNIGGEDIFVSDNKSGVWQVPQLISSLSTEGNDAPLSISTDGNKLLLFINGDIFYSMRSAMGWGEPIKYPYPINTDAWEGDAMLSSDGNAIIFVSKREGGLNPIYQDQDIYVCTKTKDGWSDAINIGATVNTRYLERSPYLHSDMKTLYFSSKGHGGLGDLDVFMTKRLNDSTWTEWSEPINLGKEFNSTNQDWGYRVTTAGDKAYFAAENSKFNHDLYSATLPMKLRPYTVATLSGALVGLDGKPIEGVIRWEDLETGNVIGESKSNPTDGSFFVVLPLGKRYGYYIEKEGFYPISKNIDLTKEVTAVTEVETITLPSYDIMINKGLVVPINNLFFDVDKSDILPASYPELNRIAQIIKERNLRIEIAGHTDNSGSKDHNMNLSDLRAKAVANYLVSKGIFMRAITTKGYGDEKPVAPNVTEADKAKNRRVELKFIK